MRSSRIPHGWIIYGLSGLMTVLFLFTVFGERGVVHLWRLRAEKKELDESSLLLQEENESLRERIDRLRHDNRYLEKIAREDLGLARPGEIIYRFVSPEPKKRDKAMGEAPSGFPRSSGQKPHR